MSVRVVVPVKVQDRELRDLGPLQGAYVRVTDLKGGLIDTLSTDSNGLVRFILPHGAYRFTVEKTGYKTPIVDFVGTERECLELDTRSAGGIYPLYANMTRDE